MPIAFIEIQDEHMFASTIDPPSMVEVPCYIATYKDREP